MDFLRVKLETFKDYLSTFYSVFQLEEIFSGREYLPFPRLLEYYTKGEALGLLYEHCGRDL